MPVTQIKNRDGSTSFLKKEKIIEALKIAFSSTGEADTMKIEHLASKIINEVNSTFDGKVPSLDDIENVIEKLLVEEEFVKTAKFYIIQRELKREIREMKKEIGIIDDVDLDINACYLLEKRYLLKDQKNNVIETTSEMFHRVSKAVAEAERLYSSDEDKIKKVEKDFCEMMLNLEFLPNSPTLMNAGRGNLIAAYNIPIEDSIRGIYKALMYSALIHQSGGGVGFSFSKLRPKGDIIYSSMGGSTGPLSFMKIFDASSDSILQSGKRKGANMAILKVNHPDIVDFIQIKTDLNLMKNFNFSIAITEDFMKAVEHDLQFDLINPRSKSASRTLVARDLWKLITTTAWKVGDPGLLFLDRINSNHHNGEVESTSACGEVPLLPYEACVLGSINLSKFVYNNSIDWDKLRDRVHKAIHFLDNVIDVNRYPVKESETVTKNNRKIGLGIMGFADMLIEMDVPYNSQKALNVADDLMRFIRNEAEKASMLLAEKRKPFPNFSKSNMSKKYSIIRNANLLAISPTGSISIIAGCSSGIEPIFSVVYRKKIIDNEVLEVNKYFEKIAKERGFYNDDIIIRLAKNESIQNIADIPYDIKKLFSSTFDIDPEWHIRMQEVFQKHVDGAVSKTVNLSNDARPEDVERVFMLAYKLGCKGVTIYRYGSRENQVMNLSS